MQSESVIAQHPFFGPVTSERHRLALHPPSGRAGVEYAARFASKPTLEDYERLAPRLPAFEAFCRRLEEFDRQMRDRFESWPRSAGRFELCRVGIDGDEHMMRERIESVRVHLPDWPMPLHGLELRYRALDENAWAFAGVPWYPPEFTVFFDEATATFSGIQDGVEDRMLGLPDTITRSRWEGAFYRHAFFGRRKLAEPFMTGGSISRLGTAMLAGRKVRIELYMNRRSMSAFEPEQLDPFVPLVGKLEELDATIRANFPEDTRGNWLADCFDPFNFPALRTALDKVFPGATSAAEVSRQSFVEALSPRRACFYLSREDSGGAVLTLDYHILPRRLDNSVFAAKISEDGVLIDVVTES